MVKRRERKRKIKGELEVMRHNPARKRESRALVTSELVERKGREDPKGGRSHAHAHAAHAHSTASHTTSSSTPVYQITCFLANAQ